MKTFDGARNHLPRLDTAALFSFALKVAAIGSPPQQEEGGRDIKKSSEASFDGADGVVWSRNSWTTPPRLHELMRLRDFS